MVRTFSSVGDFALDVVAGDLAVEGRLDDGLTHHSDVHDHPYILVILQGTEGTGVSFISALTMSQAKHIQFDWCLIDNSD